jgi:hypothetical protein
MAIRNKNIEAPGDAPRYACRAWVNFDGATTPPTVRSSGNVSSVVRNSTGDYTITFLENMPDANYCISGLTGGLNYNTSSAIRAVTDFSKSASTVRIHNAYIFPASVNIPELINDPTIYVMVFR